MLPAGRVIPGAGPDHGRDRRPGGPSTTAPIATRRRRRRAGHRPGHRDREMRAGARRSSARPPARAVREGGRPPVGRRPQPRVVALVPPATTSRWASSSTPGNSGTAAASIVAAQPLACSILWRWPSRPKPVTSVPARTPSSTAVRDAAAFSVVIVRTARLDLPGGGHAPLRSAVVIMPIPIGFVSTRPIPGRAPVLRSEPVEVRDADRDHPVERFLLGGDRVPADHRARPLPRRSGVRRARRRRAAPAAASSTGQPTTFSASVGVPPIA